jgi:hypothetical protein
VKLIFCTVLLSFGHFFSNGQPLPNWKKGTVVLSNHSVFTGEVSYQYLQDIVLFRSEEELAVLSAPRVEFFRFYDELANINRQFVCLKVEERRFKFFEVVLQGQIKVLRCPKRWSPSAKDEIDDFSYFTWDGANLEGIGKFRARVYPKLIENEPVALKSFITDSRLNPGEMKSAILIIKAYNHIIQNKQLVARAY